MTTSGDRLSLALLAAVWVGMILCVDPRGDFPLNDDWSYAHPVRVLLERGALELHRWTDPTLIAQVFWGALFCLPLGFSFEALRVSSLCAGLIGILATHRLLVEVGADRRSALLGALLLATNPLYLNLSFTFMTDVAFTATATVAGFSAVRFLRRPSVGRLLAASLFGSVAMLIRQLGLVLPLALGLGALVRKRTRSWCWLPALFAAGLFAAYQIWLTRTQSVTALRGLLVSRALGQARQDLASFALQSTHRTLAVALYLGLFLLPFLLWSGASAEPRRSGWPFRAMLPSALVACLLFLELSFQGLLPLLSNLMFDLGLGPVTLHDEYVLGLGRWPGVGAPVWFVVTVLALIGAVWLVSEVLRVLGEVRSGGVDGEGRALRVFGFSAVLLYLAPSVLVAMSDRYLLFLVPFVLMLVQMGKAADRGSGAACRPGLRRAARAAAIGLIFLSAVYSAAGTRDYLAWNRVRWSLLDDLQSRQGVAASRIDGGFEFNGLRNFQYPYRFKPGKSWWWVDDDEFMLTLGPMPGYETLRRVGFRRWLPPGEGALFLLHRLPESETSPDTSRR